MFTLKINGLLLLWKEKSKKVATENSVEKNKNGKGNPITSTLAHYFQTAHCKRRVEKKKKTPKQFKYFDSNQLLLWGFALDHLLLYDTFDHCLTGFKNEASQHDCSPAAGPGSELGHGCHHLLHVLQGFVSCLKLTIAHCRCPVRIHGTRISTWWHSFPLEPRIQSQCWRYCCLQH